MIALIRHLWSGPRYFTRRGHWLLSWGLIYVAIGLAVLTSEVTDTAVIHAINTIVPPPIYGVASVLVGVFCLWLPFRRRQHGTLEWIAFATLAGLISFRSVAHVYAFFQVDDVAQLSPAFIWLALARVHVLVAGWKDPLQFDELDEKIIVPLLDQLEAQNAVIEQLQKEKK